MNKILFVSAVTLLSACNISAPTALTELAAPAAPIASPAKATATQTVPPAASMLSASAAPAFVDKMWKVSVSSAVEVDSTYAFLSDGQLVIDSPNGMPMHGKWTYGKDALTLIEDGQRYATDIIKLDANTFQIRSHNPGGAVDITLVPAPEAPLPIAK